MQNATIYQNVYHALANSVLKIYMELLERLPLLIAGIVFLVITWLIAKICYRIIGRILSHSKLRPSFKDLIHQLSYVFIWVIGIVIAVVIIFPGVTPAKVLAGLGLGSIAIGFAFKDIVENFLAGILILWHFPFESGDYIICGNFQGKIEKITIRALRIRKLNGELVLVPNALLFKESVRIMTNKPIYRNSIICGVSYDTDINAARNVITEAVKSCKNIDHNKEVQVFAKEFASSSIDFEVTWWCGSSMLKVRESRDEVIGAVKKRPR